MSKQKQFKAIFKAFAVESLRNKLEVFFTIFFPIIFLIIFGTLYGGNTFTEDTPDMGIGIYLTEYSSDMENTLKENLPYYVIMYDDLDSMDEAIKNGDVTAGVVISSEKVSVLYVEGDMQKNSDMSMMAAIVENVVEKAVNDFTDIIEVVEIPEGIDGKIATDFDYLLSGIIALSILNAGMFSIMNLFGRYQEKGVLSRISVTPINPSTFLLSSTLVRLLMSYISVALVMFLSFAFFNAQLQINWIMFIIVVLTSTIAMMGFGILLLLIFKKPENAETAGSILMTFMMFISGIFFPENMLPEFFKVIGYFLPLKYTGILIRYSSGIADISFGLFILINAVFVTLGLLLVALTAKKFLSTT